jgi:hypothetical protein
MLGVPVQGRPGGLVVASAPTPTFPLGAVRSSDMVATSTLHDKFPPLSPVSSGTCATCPHANERHDAIALRFCAATMVQALNRGCICPSR